MAVTSWNPRDLKEGDNAFVKFKCKPYVNIVTIRKTYKGLFYYFYVQGHQEFSETDLHWFQLGIDFEFRGEYKEET